MTVPAVYFASKIRHGDMLRTLVADWPCTNVSRWHSMVHFEDQAAPADFIWCWMIDENDIRNANLLVLYSEEDDILSGALVEVGMALALGKVVIVVGRGKSFGTWINHPQILRVETLDQARHIIEEWRIYL